MQSFPHGATSQYGSNVATGSIQSVRGGLNKLEGPIQQSSCASGCDPRSSLEGGSYLANSNVGGVDSMMHSGGYVNRMDLQSGFSLQTQTAVDMDRSCMYLRNFARQQKNNAEYTDNTAGLPPSSFQSPRYPGVSDYYQNTAFSSVMPEHSRIYTRTPSPPAIDPFQDAMMSRIDTTNQGGETVSSQYQQMFGEASSSLLQQQNQARQQEPAVLNVGDKTNTSPLLPPTSSQR